MKPVKLGCAAIALLFSPLVFAGADCPKHPKEKWMSEFEIQKKIVNEYGFAMKKFKIDGDCYEIYGWQKTSDGKGKQRVEVYFNPVNGEIVKKEVD